MTVLKEEPAIEAAQLSLTLKATSEELLDHAPVSLGLIGMTEETYAKIYARPYDSQTNSVTPTTCDCV